MSYNYLDTAEFVIWKSRTIDQKIRGFRPSEIFSSKYENGDLVYILRFDNKNQVAEFRDTKGDCQVFFRCSFDDIYQNLDYLGLLKFKK